MDETFINKIKSAAVVGAGGAGFPTSFKLNAKPEYIIVNGVECEPLIQVDQQLAALYAPALIKTLDIIKSNLNAKYAVFAIKEKYHKAFESLNKEVSKYQNITVKTLPNAYPMGDEQTLVYETIARIVPEGGIPLNVGAVVVNTETLLNIGNALDDKPVTDKYITVNGDVKNPKTFKVPIGISFRELIEEAGGATVSDPVLIDGGPLMGKVQRNLDASVIKTSKAIIVLSANHPLIIAKERPISSMLKIAKTACCHCMLCTEVCPRMMLGHKLRPDKLMRLASYNSTCEKDAAATEAFLCCECRLCEYGCIMQLQPWKLHQELKKRLSQAGIKNPHHNVPEKVNQFREFRRYPTEKLVRQLGIAKYYHNDAPLSEYKKEISKVVLSMRQSFGAPCEPIIAAGEKVKIGDKIAAVPNGALGADIYASIDGTISKADKNVIIIERG